MHDRDMHALDMHDLDMTDPDRHARRTRDRDPRVHDRHDRLAAWIAAASRAVPGLDGTVVPGGAAAPAWSEAGAMDIAPMYRHLSAQHLEAGAHYWALRSWGLHVWQPVYLGVIAVHLCRCSADLSHVSQHVEQGAIRGFRVGTHVPAMAAEPDGLARTAAQLANGWRQLFAQWRAIGPLPLKSAGRLLADCVLGALTAVQRQRADWDEAVMHVTADHWLHALGLGGESGFLPYRDTDGAARLAVAPRVCCLHYRRAGAEPCDTCPRRPLAERMARLACRGGP